MAGEYLLFRRGLDALAGLGPAGGALTLYLLESLMVLILVMALISFVASGLLTYYRARDTRLLMAAPVSTSGLFLLRTIETFILTSWALGVVGVPALVALGRVAAHPLWFYCTGAGILALFAAVTAGVGALFTTIAGAALRRAPTRVAAAVVGALLVAAFVGLVGRDVIPSTSDFSAMFEPGALTGQPSAMNFIERKFALWPSHPFATGLYASATGRPAGSPAARRAVWIAPAAALLLAATVGRLLYGRTLAAIAESSVIGEGGMRAGRKRRPFPRWLRGPVGALVERDMLALQRSPHEWGRAAFLGFLLLLYTSFIFVAPVRDVGDRPDAVARLAWLNVMAAGYFLTAFGLRFVFPSTSLEGRGAWLLFSSPVGLRRLTLAKLGLYAGLLAALVVPIAVAGTIRLLHDPALVGALAILFVMVAATTCAVLLAAGAAWPNFREPHPDMLATSGGGLLGALVCLLYVAVIAWIARGIVTTTAIGGGPLPAVLGAGVVSVGLAAAALFVANRRIAGLEAP